MTEARIASIQVATIRAPLPEVIRFGPWVMEHREFALCRSRPTTGTSDMHSCTRATVRLPRSSTRTSPTIYVGERYERSGRDPLARSMVEQRGARDGPWPSRALTRGSRGLGPRCTARREVDRRLPRRRASGAASHRDHRLPANLTRARSPLRSKACSRRVAAVQAADRRNARSDAAPAAGGARDDGTRLLARDGLQLGVQVGAGGDRVRRSRSRTIRPRLDRGCRSAGRRTHGRRDSRRAPECRSRWATSRVASTTPNRCWPTRRSMSLRVDMTTNGGLTRLRQILGRIEAKGVRFAPHMFGHIHSRGPRGLGYTRTTDRVGGRRKRC